MAIGATARIRTSVINEYIRKRIEPIYRKDAFMAKLKSAGRITYGHGGEKVEWRPRFRRRTITAGDGNPVSISFPQTNTKKQATLEWVNYNLGESYTKFEKLVSQNKETAIFKIAEDAVNEMVDDFMEDFRLKLYTDGNAGDGNDLSGLETWMGSTGSVITDGVCADPSDTYAGLSTLLGNYGGDWTADTSDAWPTGTGDTEYHFWSPVLVDYTNTKFAGTAATWQYNWQKAIRYALTYGEVLQRQTYDLILLNPELLRIAKDSLDAIQQLEVTQNSDLTKLGHKTVQFDGHELVTEYGVPSAVGYLLSFDNLELMSMQKQLVGRMEDTDITTATDLKAIDFYGQMKCESPAFTAKLVAI